MNTSKVCATCVQFTIFEANEFNEAGSGRYPPLAPELAQRILDAYPDDPCQGLPASLGCTRLNGSYGAQYASDPHCVSIR